MSSTSPRKKPEVWVSNELRNTNWPKFTEWIKGNTTAQDDEKIRGVFNAGKSLFKELKDRKGLEGEVAFRSWVERVKAHETVHDLVVANANIDLETLYYTDVIVTACEYATYILEMECEKCRSYNNQRPPCIPGGLGRASNALPKCAFCRSRGVTCSWGKIPIYMHPIKVAVHAEQVKANAQKYSRVGSPMEDDEAMGVEGSDGNVSPDVNDTPQRGVGQGAVKGKRVASVSDDIESEMESVVEGMGGGEHSIRDFDEDSARDFIQASMEVIAATLLAKETLNKNALGMLIDSVDKIRT